MSDENKVVKPEDDKPAKEADKKTKKTDDDVESLKKQLAQSNEQLEQSNSLLAKVMEMVTSLTKGGKLDPDKEIEKADRGVVDWKPGQQKGKGDDYLAEKVPYYAFKDNDKYKDDITVTVNGYTYQIQRGVHVTIPRFVLHAIENSNRQMAAAADHSQGLQDAYAEKSQKYNIAT
jgi:hypothetical protein